MATVYPEQLLVNEFVQLNDTIMRTRSRPFVAKDTPPDHVTVKLKPIATWARGRRSFTRRVHFWRGHRLVVI
ncbi:hypothetical protein SEA_CHILIPEPPER_37 [Microbacterium phage ChiliPepper]|nr:hypothetical protein SEA_CHILIPEPPER_37 [Microbacterium phage ChiliPepper]